MRPPEHGDVRLVGDDRADAHRHVALPGVALDAGCGRVVVSKPAAPRLSVSLV